MKSNSFTFSNDARIVSTVDRGSNEMEIVLYSEDWEEVWSGSFAEFAAENEYSEEDARDLSSTILARNPANGMREPVTIGGGASPIFHIGLVE